MWLSQAESASQLSQRGYSERELDPTEKDDVTAQAVLLESCGAGRLGCRC